MGGHNRDGSGDPSAVSTVHKLVPINGETDSNSIFWNSKGIYNPGFVDWDSPPTYDDDVNEEDPIKEPWHPT
jgi:hypothetical protein